MNTRNRTLRSACSVLTLLLAPVVLAGCTGDPYERQITYATWKQNPAFAEPQVKRVEVQHVVAFAPKALEMNDVEQEALAMFVRQNKLQAGSQVAIAAPARTPAQSARSGNRLASVRNGLTRLGISSNVVTAAPIDGSSGDEIVVFGEAVAVMHPDCPGYNAAIAFDYEHRPINSLGCANAINLGLMVANPSDLAQGRPLGAADGEQNSLAIQRYRAGTVFPTGQGQANVPFRIETQ